MISKTQTTDRKRDEAASTIAEIHHCTADYVRKVINGERENESILTSYFDYIEGKNELINKIKTLVKLDGESAKSDRMNPESWGSLPLFGDQNSSDSAV